MSHIASFRDGSNGSSSLIWSEKLQAWFCGDSNGAIFSKKFDQDEHDSTELECEPIVAIAVDPSKEEFVVAENDVLGVRSLLNVDSVIQQNLLKTNLAFTHLQYDHTGRFL